MTTLDDAQGDTQCHTLWNKEPVYASRVMVHLDDGTDHRATKLDWQDGRPVKYLDDESYEGTAIREIDGLGMGFYPVTVPELSGWHKALSEGNPSLPHRDLTKHVRLEMLLW